MYWVWVCMFVCVYVRVRMHVLVCEREGWSWGFSIERKQTVHKEALPLSHFNVNESDSVRGLKNSLGAWRLPPLGSHMHMHAHTYTQTETHNTQMHRHKHARTHTNSEARGPDKELREPVRVSAPIRPKAVVCVCAGRRTAFYISFSTHILFFSHTHPPRAAPPGWHAVSDKTHKRQRNPPEKTNIYYISYITHSRKKERKQNKL